MQGTVVELQQQVQEFSSRSEQERQLRTKHETQLAMAVQRCEECEQQLQKTEDAKQNLHAELSSMEQEKQALAASLSHAEQASKTLEQLLQKEQVLMCYIAVAEVRLTVIKTIGEGRSCH